MSVSIFASAVRPKMWDACFKSFEGTSCDFEVVFSGHNTPEEVAPFLEKYQFFKYIHTARIKPSQNYQIALNNCTKETVIWYCDDAEAPNDVIGKAYRYWKSQNNEKLVLSIQTRESGYGAPECLPCDMNMHRFFGGRKSTPLMAPIGMISRKFMEELGGFDCRFICGQAENLAVIMAILDGGNVEIFGDRYTYVEIDHLKKSIAIGESTGQSTFIKRPFASGYAHDRKILESIVRITTSGHPVMELPFEPYSEGDLTQKSVSYKGDWE